LSISSYDDLIERAKKSREREREREIDDFILILIILLNIKGANLNKFLELNNIL